MLTGPMTRMMAATLMEAARPRIRANLKMAVRAWPAHCVRETEFTCRRLAVRSEEVILYTDRRIIIHKEERTEHSRRASLSWVTYRNGGIRCCRAWRRACQAEVSAGPWLETGPRLEVCATVAAYDGAEPWRSGRNDECGPWGGGICGETDKGGSARRSSIFAC